MDQRKNIIVYDLESYPNLFFVGTKHYRRESEDSEYHYVENSFRVWTIDESKEFDHYCKSTDDYLWVAYNNIRFDDLLLIRFRLGGVTDKQMRRISDYIINDNAVGSLDERLLPKKIYFSMKGKLNISWENRAKYWQSKVCDMMSLTGKGSLKMKAIILNADSIMESPVGFNEEITTQEQRDSVFSYVESDLDQTFILYKESETILKMRDMFYPKLPAIAYNANTPKLADEYFKLHTKCNENRRKSYSNVRFRLSSLCMNENLEFESEYLKSWWRKFRKSSIVIPPSYLESKPYIDNAELGDIDMPYYNHRITFGIGGLHSTNKNASWARAEDEIMEEADCTSMYPTSVINYGICPNHIPGYSEFVKHLVDQRNVYKFKAIESPDNKSYPILSDGFKLLNNSIFGKLGDKFAYVGDLKALYKVTVTNEVLILKLIDMMIVSGIPYDLIQVNTDAVVYKYPKKYEDQWNAMLAEWEKISLHSLGHTYYEKLYQESVNNYFAVKVGGGIKAKGNFILKPRLDQKLPVAKITRQAVIEYMLNGTEPMETIKNSIVVTDYLMSLNSTDFEHHDVRIGYKAIRVVFSKSGAPIHPLKNDNTNGGYKRFIALEGEPVKFLRVLSEHSIADLDLNYDRYCWDAWRMIYKLIKPRFDNDGLYFLPTKNEDMSWKHLRLAIKTFVEYDQKYIAQWYDYLTSLGLSVIPKNICKANYKGIRTKDKSTWGLIDPREALGLGVVTDTVCSIDIDKPEALDPKLKELLIKYPTMKVYHGYEPMTPGASKCSYLYKTDGSEKLKNSSKMVDSHGFEFFNEDNKVQMVMGVHPKCELYYVKNDIIDLPSEIVEYLKDIKVDGKRAISRIMGRKNVSVNKPSLIVNIDAVMEALSSAGITLKDTKLEDSGTSMHCWDTEGHWFVVSIGNSNGKHYINSNHSNFLNELKNIDMFCNQ